MWPFEDVLEDWFKEVDQRRKDRIGGPRDRDDEEASDMMQNEFTRGMR